MSENPTLVLLSKDVRMRGAKKGGLGISADSSHLLASLLDRAVSLSLSVMKKFLIARPLNGKKSPKEGRKEDRKASCSMRPVQQSGAFGCTKKQRRQT